MANPSAAGDRRHQGSWGHRGRVAQGGTLPGTAVRRCHRSTAGTGGSGCPGGRGSPAVGTGQDQPFPVSLSFCAAAGRSLKPGVPTMALLGHHHPAPSGPGSPSPGSSEALCKHGGLGGTRGQAAATPHPQARPPRSRHQEPSSALSPLVLGSCHHSAKKPSS